MDQSQGGNPFGRLIEFARPHKTGYIISVVLAVLGVAFALFPLVGWGGWIGFLVALGLLLLGDLCYDAWSKNRKE